MSRRTLGKIIRRTIRLTMSLMVDRTRDGPKAKFYLHDDPRRHLSHPRLPRRSIRLFLLTRTYLRCLIRQWTQHLITIRRPALMAPERFRCSHRNRVLVRCPIHHRSHHRLALLSRHHSLCCRTCRSRLKSHSTSGHRHAPLRLPRRRITWLSPQPWYRQRR